MAVDVIPYQSAARGFWNAILSNRKSRERLYIAIMIVLFILCFAGRAIDAKRKGDPLNFVVSDGRGQYVYLPSLVIDHDLDFLNQMMATWGPELQRWDFDLTERTERGVIPNKYHIGLALTIAPAFLVGHGIALIGSQITDGPWFTPDGYSPPYQLCCLALILALSCQTMCLIDRLLEGYFQLDGRVVGLGILTYWLGSNYVWYCIREPFMVHVTSCFWITVVVVECVKIRRTAGEGRISPWDIFLLSSAMSMALVCRPSNFFIAPIFIWLFEGILRAGALKKFVIVLPAVIPGLLPLGLQCFVWREMTGHWVHYGYGDERFVWSDPALLQTLFSKLRGLFVWTPLLLLSVAGILWNLLSPGGRNKSLVASWFAAALLLWYVNSSWWAWSFGRAFGARAFLELGGLFIVGLVLLFDLVRRQSPAAIKTITAMTVILMMYTWVLMGLYQFGKVEKGDDWRAGGWNPKGTPAKALAATRRAMEEIHTP